MTTDSAQCETADGDGVIGYILALHKVAKAAKTLTDGLGTEASLTADLAAYAELEAALKNLDEIAQAAR